MLKSEFIEEGICLRDCLVKIERCGGYYRQRNNVLDWRADLVGH